MTIESLERLFRDTFTDDQLKIHSELTANDVPKWDSFHHITLMISIETEFGIKFTADEIGEFRNVGEIVTSMQEKGVTISWN